MAEKDIHIKAPIVTPNAGPKPTFDYSDIRTFMFLYVTSCLKSVLICRTPPKGTTIQCRIEREKGADKLHPSFYVYLEETNQFLACARKRKKSKTSNYLISMEKSDMNRSSGNYMGKVRSNFLGTEFTMYDKGEAPESVTGINNSYFF